MKNVIPESVFILDFWTKKMSKNQKGRLTFENPIFCDHKNFYHLVTEKIISCL
jgi:hypothetical protein